MDLIKLRPVAQKIFDDIRELTFDGIGEVHPDHGQPTQRVVFRRIAT